MTTIKSPKKRKPHSAATRAKISAGRIAFYAHKPLYVVKDCGYKTPCWIWARSPLKTGYGAVNRGGKVHRAHRWMYERLRGPIPKGKHLDHLCEQKLCVNPDHLEPVTKRENEVRHARRHHGERKRCRRGHPLTGDNVLTRVSHKTGLTIRACKKCMRASQRKYKLKIRAAALRG